MLDVDDFNTWIADRWYGAKYQSHPIAPEDKHLIIAGLGLGGEAGECQEHVKKYFRDQKQPGEALLLELGDVIHYATVIGQKFGWSLKDIITANIKKLEARDAQRALDAAHVNIGTDR